MRFLRKLASVLAMPYCFLFAIANWIGWIDMFFFADQAEIDGYHFGSEPMVAMGGFKYESYENYLWSCFGYAIYLPFLIYGFWREFRERPVVPFWVLALGFGAFLWVHLYIL